jgi:putative ATPase
VHNQYLPQEVAGGEFLYKEGDTRGKIRDEEALCEWEKEENGGERWGGRDA